MSRPVSLQGFIDLHTHTNESDGTLSPSELIEAAAELGLDALAITDHDTFSGFEQALPLARQRGLRLVCGVELNTNLELPGVSRRPLHLLAYFPAGSPGPSFARWIGQQQDLRRDRNQRLVERLQGSGVALTLAEVEAKGRSLTGRPHFARVLVEKGYATSYEEAFRRFIGEDAPSFVEHEPASVEQTVAEVVRGGGVPVIAHPVRLGLRDREQEQLVFARLREAGMVGLEAIHSDQPPALQHHYQELAEELGYVLSGGSDFHGAVKPRVLLGRGVEDNVRVPVNLLRSLERTA